MDTPTLPGAPLGFLAGTRLATPKGQAAVETLKIGDLVETLHGGTQPIKWIGRRSLDFATLAENSHLLPILICAGALDDNIPTHDLYIAPGHGICIDGALFPAFRLVNNVTIEQDSLAQPLDYIQIELDEHEVLLAEGAGAESLLDETSRRFFENAAEFPRLYPEPLPWPYVPCLESFDQGFVLESVQLRLNERAELPPPAPIDDGPIRGFVDIAGPTHAAGWAQNLNQPETPVCLDILVDNIRVMRTLANQYRHDLHTAGIGSGNHAFNVPLPEPTTGTVEIRRTLDQTPLPLTDSAVELAAKQGQGAPPPGPPLGP